MKLLYIIGFLGCFLPSMTFAGVLNCFDTAKRGLQASQGQLELMADNIPNILIGQQGLRETHLRERREFIRQGIESGRLNDVHSYTPFHQSLLTMAALYGFKDLVLILIEKGADINGVAHREDACPLHFAIESERGDMVKILIEKGANVNGRADLASPLSQIFQIFFKNYRKKMDYDQKLISGEYGQEKPEDLTHMKEVYESFMKDNEKKMLLLIEYGADLDEKILEYMGNDEDFKAKVLKAQSKNRKELDAQGQAPYIFGFGEDPVHKEFRRLKDLIDKHPISLLMSTPMEEASDSGNTLEQQDK
jgi:hypothetical protein